MTEAAVLVNGDEVDDDTSVMSSVQSSPHTSVLLRQCNYEYYRVIGPFIGTSSSKVLTAYPNRDLLKRLREIADRF